MRPLRLTVVSHNLSHEGAPLVLLELVRGLHASGFARASILSMREGPLRGEYEALGCPVTIAAPQRRRLHAALGFVRERSDVVVGNTILAWWAIQAAHRIGRPTLWIIHESEPDFGLLEWPDEKRAAARALARADRVVFPAHATRAVYDPKKARSNFTVLHNGFDRDAYAARARGRDRAAIRRRLDLPDDRIVGLVAGTVSPRKSQLDAVHALARLAPDVLARLTLLVVGDVPGEYSTALHAAAARLPAHAVRIIEYAADPIDYFVAADFALSTSRMEAFPKFVQEAMHFGLPLVVAPVFGIAEQVVDCESALFFPAGDDEALAARLTAIVSDASLRARIGRGAAQALDRLPSSREMVAEYARLLRACASRSLVGAWLRRR